MPLFFRCLGNAIIGVIPGMLFIMAGSTAQGISIGLLGAFIGAALAIPGVSAGRTLRLFVTTIIARNIPGTWERMNDWVEHKDVEQKAREPYQDFLLQWLTVFDDDPRSWLVLLGLILGLIGGATISYYDLPLASQGKRGTILPLPGSKDSLAAQFTIATLMFGIWGASFAGILASRTYRRPLLLAIVFAVFFTSCIAIAISDSGGNNSSPLSLVVGFTTAAAGVGLLFGWALSRGAKEE